MKSNPLQYNNRTTLSTEHIKKQGKTICQPHWGRRIKETNQTSTRRNKKRKTRFFKKEPILCKPITSSIERPTKTTAKNFPHGLYQRRKATAK